MKKKIKDLTREEQKNICNQYPCPKCPLNGTIGCYWYDRKLERIKKELNIEVEVIEVEKSNLHQKKD